jgi:IS605 OrfB family transposase
LTDSLKQQEYNHQRNYRFSVSGRNDSVDGNFVFNYDTDNHSLKIKTGYKKECIIIDNVVFRYGQDIINHYYEIQRTVAKGNGKGKPITYTIEDKGLYYIIKCSLEEEIEITNYYKANGVNGIDFNLGFYSVCETDEFGSPLLMKDIHYELFNKTTNQVKYNIEQCIKQIVELAKANHKPLVIEDLKFKGSSKIKDYNSNSSKNFKSHMFAYTKMKKQLIASAKRNGIEVYLVDPMYTSLIGKTKYQPYYKRSIHQMAALAIARRAMYPNRTEKIPNRYKDCSSWKDIYKTANKPLKNKKK